MFEINRILCPVDLSEFSRHALDHALALARWYDAHVTVLYVSGVPLLAVPLTGMPGDVPVLPPVQPDMVVEDYVDSAAC
jgi:nucleotide-binding universal stress UspA family protein